MIDGINQLPAQTYFYQKDIIDRLLNLSITAKLGLLPSLFCYHQVQGPLGEKRFPFFQALQSLEVRLQLVTGGLQLPMQRWFKTVLTA